MAAAEAMDFTLNDTRFVELLGKLIGEAELLQHSPPSLIPREELAARHVLDALRPYTKEEGGVLEVEHVSYVEGRSNLIIKYPGTSDKTVGFVGSHLDVVPANPEMWKRNPFELTVEGDELHGRGTTDCLGHVALLTELFVELAQRRPTLAVTVAAVFIASEEASATPGVGVDGLMDHGKLDFLRNGPVYWIDCADSQPCVGCAGAAMWTMKVTGKLFHSGLPHKGINALELGMDAVKRVQDRFYADFPAHPEEARYNFATASTLKPTQIRVGKGSVNQIPGTCEIQGDIRLTPFYAMEDVRVAVERYVREINADLGSLPVRGPASKYELPAEGVRGAVELEWSEMFMTGIACKLDSPGHHALVEATQEVLGRANPYAICGSLPLVADLQAAGFDVQLTGFGLSSAYHAENEFCRLSDMRNAMRILSAVVRRVDASLRA